MHTSDDIEGSRGRRRGDEKSQRGSKSQDLGAAGVVKGPRDAGPDLRCPRAVHCASAEPAFACARLRMMLCSSRRSCKTPRGILSADRQ